MPDYRLIVGLGNPGKEYQLTRHNLGFLVIQKIAADLKLKFSEKHISNGFVAEGKIDDRKFYLLLPLTFMNNSGIALKQMIAQKEIALKETLVVVDDFNLDFGDIRLRETGSAGGHNGLKSLIEHLKTQDFSRLRIGIGAPPPNSSTTDFVLGEFSSQEKKQLNALVERAVESCMKFIQESK